MNEGATPGKKLKALLKFGALVGNQSQLLFLVGFLAGRTDWVHFVTEPWQYETWIYISIRRLPPIYRAPFQARVGGVDVTDPVQAASALSARMDDIYVQLDFDGAHEADWYQEVITEAEGDRPDPTIRERIHILKERIDETLDIYSECKRVLEGGAEDREEQVRFFLQRAENEMQGLSREIARLQTLLTQSEKNG